MKRLIAMVAVAALPGAVFAQGDGNHDTRRAAHSQLAQASEALTEGEIRKVDKSAGKLTIKHGPIQNLDMPAMSMVFRVQEPAMLDKVQSGDKVRFRAEKVGGQYTVTRIERAE